MRASKVGLLATAFLALLCCLRPQPARAAEGAPSYRAVSLRVLQQMARKGKPEVRQLGGLTRLDGFVVDPAKHDVVLIGRAAAGRPLYLDDLVVALRSSWLKYAEQRGNVRYYCPPGCSIDPRPANLAALQQLGSRLSQSREWMAGADEWRSIATRDQDVRVLGIPPTSRFAKVMVEADYFMKKVADGCRTLDIMGLESLTNMRIAQAKQGRGAGGLQMDRFWFTPGQTSYSLETDAVMVQACPVVLLTEREYQSGGGKRSSTGTADPLATAFTTTFTNAYPSIAEREPIYADLEGLFRLVAVTQAMKADSSPQRAGLSLDYLLGGYTVSRANVPKALPGVATVREERWGTSNGTAVYTALTCGGVSMQIDVQKSTLVRDAGLRSLRSRILAARPAASALRWDVRAR